MRKFARKFITEWRWLGLPFENETIIAAISGGADSVSLFLALKELVDRKKLRLKIVVAHFDHGLRGRESSDDERFVEKLAREFNFEFICGKSSTKIQNQKGNLEQTARNARYDFLKQVAMENQAYGVLTAHTLNDQAETFLFNLLRGSGLDGLAAMKPVSKIAEDSEILLVRPLLGWATREETESYVAENNQSFRHDAMNDDLNFTRVRIRKNLLPVLKRDYNPKITETLARTASLIDSQKNFNSAPDVAFMNPFSIKELKNLPSDELQKILREWLKRERGNLRKLSHAHFRAVADLVTSRKSGRKIELPGGETVTKSGGKLYFKKAKVEKSPADN